MNWSVLTNLGCALQIFFIFTPKIGEDEPILTHISQLGWNQQLVMLISHPNCSFDDLSKIPGQIFNLPLAGRQGASPLRCGVPGFLEFPRWWKPCFQIHHFKIHTLRITSCSPQKCRFYNRNLLFRGLFFPLIFDPEMFPTSLLTIWKRKSAENVRLPSRGNSRTVIWCMILFCFSFNIPSL